MAAEETKVEMEASAEAGDRSAVGGLLLGISTPVVTLLPGNHGPWEAGGTIEDIAAVAKEADRLGYDHLTCSEHVMVPDDVAPARGGRYWDPLPVFGYLAAVTSRIRFATNVLVLGYHHPLDIAKRYGTLDVVTGGRLVLGVGVGSLQEEFELLGADFPNRGERADDALRALRAALSEQHPSYEGRYYRFSRVVVDPCAVQRPVPVWIGGRTARSLRRAIELGDGWVPFGLGSDALGELVARARQGPGWEKIAERTERFDLVYQTGRPVDPLEDPGGTRHVLGRLLGAGATGVQLRFVHTSRSHLIEQLGALLEVIGGGVDPIPAGR